VITGASGTSGADARAPPGGESAQASMCRSTTGGIVRSCCPRRDRSRCRNDVEQLPHPFPVSYNRLMAGQKRAAECAHLLRDDRKIPPPPNFTIRALACDETPHAQTGRDRRPFLSGSPECEESAMEGDILWVKKNTTDFGSRSTAALHRTERRVRRNVNRGTGGWGSFEERHSRRRRRELRGGPYDRGLSCTSAFRVVGNPRQPT
jgi:hypothetical protein